MSRTDGGASTRDRPPSSGRPTTTFPPQRLPETRPPATRCSPSPGPTKRATEPLAGCPSAIGWPRRPHVRLENRDGPSAKGRAVPWYHPTWHRTGYGSMPALRAITSATRRRLLERFAGTAPGRVHAQCSGRAPTATPARWPTRRATAPRLRLRGHASRSRGSLSRHDASAAPGASPRRKVSSLWPVPFPLVLRSISERRE